MCSIYPCVKVLPIISSRAKRRRAKAKTEAIVAFQNPVAETKVDMDGARDPYLELSHSVNDPTSHALLYYFHSLSESTVSV